MNFFELPAGWRWVKLDDVQEQNNKHAIVSGPFGSNIGKRFFVQEGVPVIRGNNLTTNGTRFVDKGFVFITNDKARELSTCEALPSDLIFTAAGTLGQVGLIPADSNYKKYIISNKQLRVRLNTEMVNELFAYYWFSSPLMMRFIQQLNTGSSVPLINLQILRSLPIPLPPIKEQEKIVRILGTLDDKIELNNKISITLEEIAQTLFKHWFVDFEFPSGNGKPYKSSFGKMENSEQGCIPRGWTLAQIRNCGTVICGKTPPTLERTYYGIDLPFITIPDMRNQTFVVRTTKGLSLKGGNSQKKTQLPPLSICVSCIATPGLVALTSQTSHTNQQINSIICNENISPFFMYYTMLNLGEKIRLWGSGGTATLNLNKTDFERLAIIIPPNVIMKDFHRIIAPLFKKILSTGKENITLSRMRDALLPKLLSGQITVSKTSESSWDELRDTTKPKIQKKLLDWSMSPSR
jgi:type I restriction enzyme S subunit